MTAEDAAPGTRAIPARAARMALALALLTASPHPASAFTPDDLPAIEQQVARDHPSLAHISPEDLAAMMASATAPLLLDVREEAEFAVSHLPGARRIPPGAWTRTVLRAVADDAKDRTVVLYCSVGVRSSRLADQVKDELMKRGARAVANLRGGIFRWHNETRPLVSGTAPTDLVHPYDSKWGGLLRRKSDTSAKPAP